MPPPTQHNPLSPDKQEILAKAIKGTSLEIEVQQSGLIPSIPAARWKSAISAFITNDPATLKVKQQCITLAPRQECVFIRGESGVGKELLANILHGERIGEFVDVNSTAVSPELFESELFGSVRGSYTGSIADRIGYIAQAKHGTLFLDEIGDMPLHLQCKLLRVIQSREYRMVGASKKFPVECRIVAASHRDIENMILDGDFRLDLYQRLAMFELTVKPLRVRKGDIKLFVQDEQLLEKVSQLKLHGNIRELLNLKLRWEVLGEI